MNWISVDDDHKPDEWEPVLVYSPRYGYFVATYADGYWVCVNTTRVLVGMEITHWAALTVPQ